MLPTDRESLYDDCSKGTGECEALEGIRVPLLPAVFISTSFSRHPSRAILFTNSIPAVGSTTALS